MFNLKDLSKAIQQIAEEKGIDAARVLEAVETSLAAAYKKEYGEKGEVMKAHLDLQSGELKFWQVKTVVDETTVRMPKEGEEEMPEPEALRPGEGGEDVVVLPRYNAERHILLDEAKKIKSEAKVGDELEFPLETHEDFGRIAAQTAKQVIIQKLREAERQSILQEFSGKEGAVVSGIIQRLERGHVYVDLGRAIGVMFSNETIPGEYYRSGTRMKFFVVAVQEDTRLPSIVLSRSHPRLVSKLFELEVPEIADGVVEIKAIAREPGHRTKIAVASNVEKVDPVGSCVGQRGTRVMAVTNELGEEKIDIIEWADDPEAFVANSLSPAKVTGVEISPRREARVYVPEDQLSLAIGRGGQNVRLAARLTGWKIDVRSQAHPEMVQEGGVAEVPEAPKGPEESSN